MFASNDNKSDLSSNIQNDLVAEILHIHRLYGWYIYSKMHKSIIYMLPNYCHIHRAEE